MARFLVWSDLHDEFWNGFDLPDLSGPVDGVLIGGDTHTRGRHLDIPAAAARRYDCPVVVIWGNHEAYDSTWSELLAEEKRQLAALHAEGLDIRVLHGASTEIAGVRIIGATLWTDFKLYPGLEALARIVVPRLLNDYHAIRTAPGRLFTKADMLALHAEQKAAVFDALAQPHPGPTVVMTHHLPVRQLIHPAPRSAATRIARSAPGLRVTCGTRSRPMTSTAGSGGTATRATPGPARVITGRSVSSPTSAAIREKRRGSIRRLCWRCSGWQGWCGIALVAQDNPSLVASGVSQGR